MGNSINKFNLDDFKKYNYDNCKFIFQEGYKTIGRVVDIYDGDTCTVIIYYGGEYIKYPVRLFGIDTCEIKSKNEKNNELAYQARHKIYNLITSKQLDDYKCKRTEIRKILNEDVYLVVLDIAGLDKYGRLLADMFKYDNNNKQNILNVMNLFKSNEKNNNKIKTFSKILLEEKLAYAYDGKTKKTENEQIIEM